MLGLWCCLMCSISFFMVGKELLQPAAEHRSTFPGDRTERSAAGPAPAARRQREALTRDGLGRAVVLPDVGVQGAPVGVHAPAAVQRTRGPHGTCNQHSFRFWSFRAQTRRERAGPAPG